MRSVYTWLMHVLEVFTSSHCPGCPEALAIVERFCDGRTDILLIRHDVAQALERAMSYRLFATPALVIDRRHVIYGVPSVAALERHCGPAPQHCA